MYVRTLNGKTLVFDKRRRSSQANDLDFSTQEELSQDQSWEDKLTDEQKESAEARDATGQQQTTFMSQGGVRKTGIKKLGPTLSMFIGSMPR